jgi:hypothetical protein
MDAAAAAAAPADVPGFTSSKPTGSGAKGDAATGEGAKDMSGARWGEEKGEPSLPKPDAPPRA